MYSCLGPPSSRLVGTCLANTSVFNRDGSSLKYEPGDSRWSDEVKSVHPMNCASGDGWSACSCNQLSCNHELISITQGTASQRNLGCSGRAVCCYAFGRDVTRLCQASQPVNDFKSAKGPDMNTATSSQPRPAGCRSQGYVKLYYQAGCRTRPL